MRGIAAKQSHISCTLPSPTLFVHVVLLFAFVLFAGVFLGNIRLSC